MRNWRVPLFLFVLCLLTFGVYIPWLGLYGDDWQYLYAYHLLGAGEFPNFVAADRPLSAWVYMLFTPLLGENVWAYQLLVLLLRWLGGVGIWWVLRTLLPERNHIASWVAALFVVYPSFKQQWLPLEYVLHFSILALFFLSLVLMLRAVATPNRYWVFTIPALIASLGMFSVEYFVGLEFLRPALLWLMLGQETDHPGRKLRRTFFLWLPYLMVLVAFIIWRVFIYQFQYYEPKLIESLLSNPVKGAFGLVWRVLGDLILVIFSTWGQAWQGLTGARAVIMYATFLLLVFVFLAWGLRRVISPAYNQEQMTERGTLWMIGMGAVAMLVAGLPFWVVDVPLWIVFPWDRSTLPFMLGASMFVIGLVVLLIRPKFQVFVVAGFLTLAVGIHFQTAQTYRTEWRYLQNFLWQLTWRAPGIRENTILLTDALPFNYYGDNSLSPALNWTYAPDLRERQIPYRIFDLNIRSGSFFPTLGRDLPVTHNYRSFRFQGNTSAMVLVYYNPPGCLRIVDAQEGVLIPGLPPRLKDAAYLSRLDLIDPQSNPPARPPKVVGAQPELAWCYFFEKAELAAQQGQWQTVVDLGNKAFEQSYRPAELSEYLVFIKGYAHVHNLDEATRLSQEMSAEADETVLSALCATWDRLEKSGVFSADEGSRIAVEKEKLNCGNG
ncbi:MAG: hypothetical protein HPY45_06055 [Anaerolineae bacterium]|nr:hypothetical protein [Anaerolineae bacterium]